MTDADANGCWVCGGTKLRLEKPSNAPAALTAADFAISDHHYGRTGTLYRCADCGFLQCGDVADVLSYYEALQDPEYDSGRAVRAEQARDLLRIVAQHCPSGRLLDVGAGSGILVEAALAKGYAAEGLEPSQWLQARAVERGLRVIRGVLPNAAVSGPYHVITLVDVLEHVPDPLPLLRECRNLLAPNGILAIATPDERSLARRLMGWRWWHFRLAHLGYFSRATLTRLCRRADLAPVEFARPGWHFRLDYLAARIAEYFPGRIRLPLPEVLARRRIPLNLFDSLLLIVRRAGE